MSIIEKRVQEIKEDLDFFDDELSKYEYIIDLGKKLPEFDEAEKIPANIVHGCTSQVWLTFEIKDGKSNLRCWYSSNNFLFTLGKAIPQTIAIFLSENWFSFSTEPNTE